MLQNLVIRKATPSDAGEITTLYLASRSKYISFAPLVHSDTAIQQCVRDTLIPDTQVWVVTQDNKIIGMMAILEKQEMNWIEQLYILPKMTGQEIGSLLMDKAKSLHLPIRLHTFQENLGARRFYERHGFKIIAFTDGSGNEERCSDMLYEWRMNSKC